MFLPRVIKYCIRWLHSLKNVTLLPCKVKYRQENEILVLICPNIPLNEAIRCLLGVILCILLIKPQLYECLWDSSTNSRQDLSYPVSNYKSVKFSE